MSGMTNTECSFSSDSRAPGVHRCISPATHTVRDRRPLPDGTLRPAVPACEGHATTLLETGNYLVSFPLWSVR